MDGRVREEREEWGKSKVKDAQVEILLLCLCCGSCVSEDALPALPDKEGEIYHLSVVPYTLNSECENPPDTHT